MNKEKFLKELANKTGLGEEKCSLINGVIEDTFLVGIKNKEKMIDLFKEKLNIGKDEAENIYEVSMGILSSEVVNKIKHPFS